MPELLGLIDQSCSMLLLNTTITIMSSRHDPWHPSGGDAITRRRNPAEKKRGWRAGRK